MVGELFTMPSHVLLVEIDSRIWVDRILQELQEKGMGDNHVTLQLRAFRKHARSSAVFNLVFEVFGPADCVELMSTREGLCSIVRVFLFKINEADAACVLVILFPGAMDVFHCLLQVGVEDNPDLLLELIDVLKPSLLHALLVPVEMSENSDDLVVISSA